MRRFALNVLAAFIMATIGMMVFAAGLAGTEAASARPRPVPSKTVHTVPVVPLKSSLATILRVEDCPTEDPANLVCVWDASWAGNGVGDSFLWVYGQHFHVGFNDDGTVWVDDNHDGEPGHTDS